MKTYSKWGRLELIAVGLELNGYELSRGTVNSEDGFDFPTFDIRSPNYPEWEGVWMPWDSALDVEGDDDELLVLMALVAQAFVELEHHREHFQV